MRGVRLEAKKRREREGLECGIKRGEDMKEKKVRSDCEMKGKED